MSCCVPLVRYKIFCDSLSGIELHSLFPVLPALVDAAMPPNVGITSLGLSPEAVQGRVGDDGDTVTSTGRGYVPLCNAPKHSAG